MTFDVGDRVTRGPVALQKSGTMEIGDRVRVNDIIQKSNAIATVGDRCVVDPVGIWVSGGSAIRSIYFTGPGSSVIHNYQSYNVITTDVCYGVPLLTPLPGERVFLCGSATELIPWVAWSTLVLQMTISSNTKTIYCSHIPTSNGNIVLIFNTSKSVSVPVSTGESQDTIITRIVDLGDILDNTGVNWKPVKISTTRMKWIPDGAGALSIPAACGVTWTITTTPFWPTVGQNGTWGMNWHWLYPLFSYYLGYLFERTTTEPLEITPLFPTIDDPEYGKQLYLNINDRENGGYCSWQSGWVVYTSKRTTINNIPIVRGL